MGKSLHTNYLNILNTLKNFNMFAMVTLAYTRVVVGLAVANNLSGPSNEKKLTQLSKFFLNVGFHVTFDANSFVKNKTKPLLR